MRERSPLMILLVAALLVGPAVVLSPAGPGSAARADDAPEPPKPFSHKYHVEEEGAGCKDCHDSEAEKPVPPLNKQACIDCHDEVPAYQPPTKARKLPIAFPHATHTEVAECVDCHAATANDAQKAGEPVMGFDRCASCHVENGVEIRLSSCATCHGKDMKRTAPADHAVNWRTRHGREATWRVFDDHGKDCKTCHEQDACKTCHTTERPRSHTALWRTRTHGVAAEWERDACKTCHETGTCVRCHQNNAPLNHRGGWVARHGLAASSKMDAKCSTCHTSAECVACHSGALR